MTTATTAQTIYPVMQTSKMSNAVESYSACYGAHKQNVGIPITGPLPRQSKKKNKHLRVSAHVYGTATASNLKMYSRETLSPTSNNLSCN